MGRKKYGNITLTDEDGRLTIDMDAPKTVTLSYDEKPDIQVL